MVYSHTGSFRFLDLPPELRNNIYSMLLVFDGPTFPVCGKPISVTSQIKHMRRDKIDGLSVPPSAPGILLVNHQMHTEASGMFYQENHLVFSAPKNLLSFTLSLGDQRLDNVRNLTCFYEENYSSSTQSKNKVNKNMGLTLGSNPRFKHLKKLHLCFRNRNPRTTMTYMIYGVFELRDLASLPGIATLFTLRSIPDIEIRDLDLEDCDSACKQDFEGSWNEAIDVNFRHVPVDDLHKCKRMAQANIDKSKAMLKHLNHGLQLAQFGFDVQGHRFTRDGWYNGPWPGLPELPCGPNGVCSCGDSEVGGEADKGEDSSETVLFGCDACVPKLSGRRRRMVVGCTTVEIIPADSQKHPTWTAGMRASTVWSKHVPAKCNVEPDLVVNVYGVCLKNQVHMSVFRIRTRPG